jgi:ferredoxin
MKKVRFVLEYPPQCSEKPLMYHLIKDFDLRTNILRGTINAGKEGKLLVEVEGEEANIDKGMDFLRRENIRIKLMSQQIRLKDEECIHCGACTGVCFSGALKMDTDDWKLLFDPEKCVACELCVPACPLQLIHVGFN